MTESKTSNGEMDNDISFSISYECTSFQDKQMPEGSALTNFRDKQAVSAPFVSMTDWSELKVDGLRYKSQTEECSNTKDIYGRQFSTISQSASNSTFKDGMSAATTSPVSIMYGDLINGLCYTVFVPFYAFLAQKPEYRHEVGPNLIFGVFVWTALWSWKSFASSQTFASILANLGMTVSIAFMNLYQWPHANDNVVVPQFIWSLLIVTANTSLSILVKMGLALVATVSAILILAHHNEWDKLPMLLGAGTVYAVFHVQMEYRVNANSNNNESSGSNASNSTTNSSTSTTDSLISAHAASLILAGSFCYYASHEMIKMYFSSTMYSAEGGYNILRMGFFAIVGLAAAGNFRRETQFKHALEVLVAQRSQELRRQAQQLRQLEHALQASETAIALVDDRERILWYNTALQALTHTNIDTFGAPKGVTLPNRTLQHSNLLNVLNGLRLQDRLKLERAFHSQALTSTTLHDIELYDKKYMEAEISPFPTYYDESVDHSTLIGLNCDVDNDEIAQLMTPRFLVVFKDLTERRARERAEKAAERESLVAKAMNESMQTLSHELRTPLQGIMGLASLMLTNDAKVSLAPELHECMNMIMISSRLLLTLINNMLETRKFAAGRMDEFTLNPLPLGDAIMEASHFCRCFATISDITLEVDDLIAQDVIVRANALRFQQVMINLLSNAIKYSPSKSTVSISSRVMTLRDVEEIEVSKALAVGIKGEASFTDLPRNDVVVAVISISDEGKGIGPDHKNRIFGRFAQLGNQPVSAIGGKASGSPSGTGLGLNLCTEFLHRMNGKVWVSNNNDKGACFSFYLPIIGPPPSSAEFLPLISPSCSLQQQMSSSSEHILRPKRPKIRVRTKSKVASKLKILVVDDTLINLKVLRRMLIELGVAHVSTVDSGLEALSMLETDRFDFVLTDLQMPDMSGTVLSKTIHKDYASQCSVVIGLTADSSEAVEATCMESGMAYVLHKPITQDELFDFFENIYPLYCPVEQ